MPSSHLILCRPLLLLPPIPPSIRVFSNESTLCLRWPKYWSFSFSIIPSKEHPGLISFRMDWLDLLAVQGTLRSLLQHHSSKAVQNCFWKHSSKTEPTRNHQESCRVKNSHRLWASKNTSALQLQEIGLEFCQQPSELGRGPWLQNGGNVTHTRMRAQWDSVEDPATPALASWPMETGRCILSHFRKKQQQNSQYFWSSWDSLSITIIINTDGYLAWYFAKTFQY